MAISDELIQGLLDERDIRNVLTALGLHTDQKDFVATAALYAEQGALITPWGSHHGRDGLAKYITDDLGGFPGLQHVTTGHVIDVAADRKTAQARMVLISTHILNEDGTAYTSVGAHYEIQLIRLGDDWQILRNEIFPAWRTKVEGGMTPAGVALS
ncbi:MAG: hypothetical protein JWN80_2955 [Microbacteriaceae bacterium]|nr:hypothetical protein [Microbacteriaceae bacterium]